MHPLSGAFDGLDVVDLTRLLPGPFATLLLADLGADVVKIEAPDVGDYARAYPPFVEGRGVLFSALNRNKRSVSLDLKSDVGREAFRQMVVEADVVVESFRPGVLPRLGLAPDGLRALNDELIVCSISGYGREGPESAAHDLNVIARAGLLHHNARSGEPPAIPGFQVADLAGGALYAAFCLASALYARERGAGGCHLDVSMADGALSLMAPRIAMHAAGSREAPGEGLLDGGVPAYDLYETADGRYLAVGALEPEFWNAFVEALGREDLTGEGLSRGDQGESVRQEIAEAIGTRDLDHWRRVFAGVDACVEAVQTLDEVIDDALFQMRGRFFDLQGVRQTRTPATPDDISHAPAPQLGEHTAEVLKEYGVDPSVRRALEDG
jgi:crotonobetainyl-CoA:carnitine CoA-transferase CaiB-like acyl-CoA transferase